MEDEIKIERKNNFTSIFINGVQMKNVKSFQIICSEKAGGFPVNSIIIEFTGNIELLTFGRDY